MRYLLLAFLLCFSMSLQAQDWQSDMDTAIKLAKENDQTIILVFQGSDWCAPCIRLNNEIWSTEEFQQYASEHFVMLKAYFPRKKNHRLDPAQQEKNNQLAERYNRGGYFPVVVVLDQEGKVLGETGYQQLAPAKFIELLESFEG